MSYTLHDQIRAHERDIEKIKARAKRRAERLNKPFDLTMREWRKLNSLEGQIAAAKRILAAQNA